jgi:iron complex outermembrane receptor protein
MMLKSRSTALVLLCSLIIHSAIAQTEPKDTTRTQTLNTVRVTGWSNGQKGSQLDIARSVGLLTAIDFHRTSGLSLENSLNLIPGVVMQSRSTFGGQRISIRGYGNNTNFNGQGVQVLLNNIPITDATGLTILDDVDFATLGKVEVIKGPASSLYGSGIAGVVNLYTLKPQPGQTRFVQENTFGSYGLWRNNTRIETAGEHSSLLFNYGHQESEGFRQHSASSKDYAQMSGDFYVSDKGTISTYFAYAHSHEELPGELDSARFYGKQKWSDPDYLANNSKVDIESFRGGVTSDYKIDGHFSNLSTVFFNGYTLYSPFARGLTDNQAFTFGGRTGFVYTSGAGDKVHGIFGAQFQKTLAFNKSYNLTNNVTGGIRGDLQNASMSYNVFTEWKFTLPSQFILTAGGSLNFTEFGITDMLANSANPTHLNVSGTRSFPAIFTPRLSLLKLINDHISVYADVSRGYTPPATANVVIGATGQVNDNLKPESGFQYEIGTKGDLFNRKLSYQLALFDLDVHNKFVTQTVPAAGSTPQYTFYLNAGRQQDLGAELSLSYDLLDDKNAAVTRLRPFVTYAWSNFKYKDFKSDHNNNSATIDFSDKKVAGVAPNVVNIGLDMQTKIGFYAYLTYRYNDKVPYTFDNLHYAKSYDLLNAKIGYRSLLGSHFSVDLYAGADNLTGSTCYSFLFYSGTITGTTDPHFLPMPYKTTIYGGAKLAYIF